MNNIKNNLFIGIITFILCIAITITTGINLLWLIVPIIFIALIIFLSSFLKARFGRTYGIAGILVLIFVIPIGWYLFSSSMPITSKMMESQKKAEDLSAFQQYAGSVDAKKEVAQYQMKQDSILKEQVSSLLNAGNIDSALKLIKQNETSSEKIKKELFSSIPVTQNNTVKSQVNDDTVIESKNTKDNFGGQLAIINDPDGYTNIRSGQGSNYTILGIIYRGENFYAKPSNSDWWQVKNNQGIIGYMHKNRVQLIR